MRKIDILHIYHGSQGSGGLYIDEIYSQLNKLGYSQQLISSYYFPFEYGRKVFFKFTDLIAQRNLGYYRIYFRFIELLFGYFLSIIIVLQNKPKIINYSLISSYKIDLYFIKTLKIFSKSKIIITCHDVIPFGESQESIDYQISIRKKILKVADFFIVHNNNSKQDLMNVFKIEEIKILHHSFPIMDLNKFGFPIINNSRIYDFAFIGHLRKSKGLNLLLKSWAIFEKEFPNATLLIAGNLPKGVELSPEWSKFKNVDLKLSYLSDEEYFTIIQRTRNILLPYTSGTNSGVLFNLFTQNIGIIHSNIQMFRNIDLLSGSGMFVNNDADDLARIMKIHFLNDFSLDKKVLEDYRKKFNYELISVYSNILNRS